MECHSYVAIDCNPLGRVPLGQRDRSMSAINDASVHVRQVGINEKRMENEEGGSKRRRRSSSTSGRLNQGLSKWVY